MTSSCNSMPRAGCSTTATREKSLRWTEKILRERPQHPETNRLLADYYEKQGNRGLANFYRVQAGEKGDRGTEPPPTRWTVEAMTVSESGYDHWLPGETFLGSPAPLAQGSERGGRAAEGSPCRASGTRPHRPSPLPCSRKGRGRADDTPPTRPLQGWDNSNGIAPEDEAPSPDLL